MQVLPIKHGSLKQNGSGELEIHMETPTGVVILRRQLASGCFQSGS